MSSREHELIAHYFSGLDRGEHTVLGVGDDAAVLDIPAGTQLVTSVDTAVEGRHFPAETLPEYVAFRSIASAASDLAAMGADPLAMLLSVSLPGDDSLWLTSFAQGLLSASTAMALPLVGGDLTRGPLSVSVTVMGTVPAGRAITRSGAREGDAVFITGTLGDAAAGLACMQGEIETAPLAADDVEFLEQRFLQPTPRFSITPLLRFAATAGIDVSDGLLADARHVATASNVAIEIDANCLPLSPSLQSFSDRDQVIAWALQGGDDYEVLFTGPADLPLPPDVTQIGSVVAGTGVQVTGAHSERQGYDHFA